MTVIFALTNRGLESISAAEIAGLPDTQINQVAYRRVEADFAADLSLLLDLRAVDDVFIKLATWTDVGHARRWLAVFTELSQQLGPGDYVSLLTDLRSIPDHPHFSVTVSFVGKRNYSAPEVKMAVAEGILRQERTWEYVDDDREADLNLRVFIEHQTALVGLRIAEGPLHRRSYKVHHQPGALKPTVAAAMLQIAGVKSGSRVVDPFCGSGTILTEAALMGAIAIGGDLEGESIRGALLNSATVPITLFQGDARHIPLPDHSVDYVISNMPWGRQVLVDDDLKRLYQQAFAEMRRIVEPGGKIVLLTTFPELLDAVPDDALEISLFGQNPHIVTFNVAN